MTSITTQCFASITANLARFALGMMQGWSTSVVPSLEDPNAMYPMSSDEIGWIMSMLGVGAVIGPIITWLAIDRVRRKMTIIMCIIPIIASFAIMTFRADYPFLLTGRILGGVGMSLSLSSIPLYIGEIAENRIRGAMTAIGVTTNCFGNILILIVGPYVTMQRLNIICTLLAFMVLLAMFFIPESPYYYLMKDDTEKATKSLSWLRKKANVDIELKSMKDYVENRKCQKTSIFDLFTYRGNRRAFFILLTISLMESFSGGVAISIYAYEIFEDSGYKLSLHTLVIIMGVISMIASFCSLFTVDIFGRKPVLLFSSAILSLSHIANAIFYTLKSQDYDVSKFTLFPFIVIIIYTIGKSGGLHCLPHIILSEYFSTNVKAEASMCYMILDSIGSAISVKLFQLFNDAFGLGPLFFICSLPLIIFSSILYFVMPETKGCSLQEIEDMHSGKGDVISIIKNIEYDEPSPQIE